MPARYEPIAENYLSPKVRGQHEFMCACPFCAGDMSLQFNIDSGLWVCFRCDAKGNAKGLMRKLGKDFIDPALSVEHIRQRMDKMRLERRRRAEGPRILEDSYLKRFQFNDPYWTKDRGFSKRAVAAWDLGYDPISDRHTIAYRNSYGELLGVIQRLKGDLDPDTPRYIYEKNFDRKNSLFGSWKITNRKIALVEGSTDVISLDDAGVMGAAQYGSSISRGQISLLHILGVKEVVLFYDYDEAGRKAVEATRERARGIILRQVSYDDERFCWHARICGCGQHNWRTIGHCAAKKHCRCNRIHGADPGSLKKKEIRKMYEEAELVGSLEWKKRKH
jgi:hypothetical protein